MLFFKISISNIFVTVDVSSSLRSYFSQNWEFLVHYCFFTVLNLFIMAFYDVLLLNLILKYIYHGRDFGITMVGHPPRVRAAVG